MNRVLFALHWAWVSFAGGDLTVYEIRLHIARLKARRLRLNAQSMTLAHDIAHWEGVLATRPRKPVDQDEIGAC